MAGSIETKSDSEPVPATIGTGPWDELPTNLRDLVLQFVSCPGRRIAIDGWHYQPSTFAQTALIAAGSNVIGLFRDERCFSEENTKAITAAFKLAYEKNAARVLRKLVPHVDPKAVSRAILAGDVRPTDVPGRSEAIHCVIDTAMKDESLSKNERGDILKRAIYAESVDACKLLCEGKFVDDDIKCECVSSVSAGQNDRILRILLENGGGEGVNNLKDDFTGKMGQRLAMSAKYGNAETFKIMLKYAKPEPMNHALNHAARYKKPQIVKLLLASGCIEDSRIGDCVLLAEYGGDDDTIALLKEYQSTLGAGEKK